MAKKEYVMTPQSMVDRLDELLEQGALPKSVLDDIRELADELDGISNVTWSNKNIKSSLVEKYEILTKPFG